jgi:hypothetical protein
MTYNLKQDHTAIKELIKEWEMEIDTINVALETVFNESTLGDIPDLQRRLDNMSDEMMSINV